MAKKDVTKPISLDPRGGRPREKCVTGIEGIDRILNGGIKPTNDIKIVTDIPGCLSHLVVPPRLLYPSQDELGRAAGLKADIRKVIARL